MNKEKATRMMVMRMQPSLFEKFQAICNRKFKSVSATLREYILQCVEDEEKQNKKK